MDFIKVRSNGKEVIFALVDQLSKYPHFIALHHPYTAMVLWMWHNFLWITSSSYMACHLLL